MIDTTDMTDEALFERVVAEEQAASRSPKPIDLRRAHQCRHDGCDSRAQWEVYVHLRYGLHHKAIESLKCTIRVCDLHRKEAAAFITTPHNKKVISTKLATIGRLSIDWDNAMVEFVPCGEKPWSPVNMQELKVA